jgi:hypothetical protein
MALMIATRPSQMDGPDPLVASPLASWSIQTLGSYLANLRGSEIPGSLPPVLLGWTARILSWLRHSRLGASKLWALTSRTSEVARSLDLCHLSSSDGWLDPLVASPLVTWSIQTLGSYLANLRGSEIPRSLPHVLLGWTARITRDLEHPTFGILP